MRNKKTWLIIKACVIILFTVMIFAIPTEDSFRKWMRFIMLTVFVISFILDLNKYRNSRT
jgi:hypothetical protein